MTLKRDEAQGAWVAFAGRAAARSDSSPAARNLCEPRSSRLFARPACVTTSGLENVCSNLFSKKAFGAKEHEGPPFLLHWVFCLMNFFFSWGPKESEKGRVSESDITKACVYFYDQFCPEKKK